MNKKCKQCGSVITRHIRKHELNRGKFCSRECYYQSKRAKKVELNCAYCGKKFEREKWRLTTKPMKRYFCSRQCYGLHKKAYPELYDTSAPPNITGKKINKPFRKCLQLNCDLLEKEYCEGGHKIAEIAEKYNIGYSTVNSRIRKCGIQTDRGRYWEQTSYTAIRNKIKRERDDRCEICGWSKGICDTHHKVEKINGGSDNENNLIIVCPNCHRLIHEGQLKV